MNEDEASAVLPGDGAVTAATFLQAEGIRVDVSDLYGYPSWCSPKTNFGWELITETWPYWDLLRECNYSVPMDPRGAEFKRVMNEISAALGGRAID